MLTEESRGQLNRKNRTKSRNLFFVLFVSGILMFAGITLLPAKVAKADGAVSFGSAYYTPAGNSNFNIGVYVNSTDAVPLGAYSVTLTYDPNVIEYVGGASSGGNGSITINGTSLDGGRSQTMLTLRTIGTGDTIFGTAGATIYDAYGNLMNNDSLAAVTVSIQPPRTATPETIKINGKNITGLTEGRTEYTFTVPYADRMTIEVPDGYTATPDKANLTEGRNELTLSVAQQGADPIVYTLHINMSPDKRTDEEKAKAQEGEDGKTDGEDPDKQSDGKDNTGKDSTGKDNTGNAGQDGEKNSEIDLPPIPADDTIKADNDLQESKKAILILGAFMLAVAVLVAFKIATDYLESAGGKRRADLQLLRRRQRMAVEEKYEEKANPIDFASIDVSGTDFAEQERSVHRDPDFDGEVLFAEPEEGSNRNDSLEELRGEDGPGTVLVDGEEMPDLFGDAEERMRKRALENTARIDGDETGAFTRLDFGHRFSAGEIAAMEKSGVNTVSVGSGTDGIYSQDSEGADEGDVDEILDGLMTSSKDEGEDDFIDIDEFSDRK